LPCAVRPGLTRLIDEWGLRAWVREARYVDEDQG